MADTCIAWIDGRGVAIDPVTFQGKPDFVNFLDQTNGRKQLHDFLREVDEW